MAKCGDCKHWMKKSDCPKEKSGLNKPTSKTWACEKFTSDKETE
ncbi:hypothetical protein V7149_00405 [Bacillus sp. JJ1503]